MLDTPIPGAWKQLCFETWLGAHPSWLRGDVAPPCWAGVATRAHATQRWGYRRWCDHFGVEQSLPLDRMQQAVQVFDGLPIDDYRLNHAILFIGMVASASRPGFASDWIGYLMGAICAVACRWRNGAKPWLSLAQRDLRSFLRPARSPIAWKRYVTGDWLICGL